MDLFDFTSFLAWTFLNFLARCVLNKIQKYDLTSFLKIPHHLVWANSFIRFENVILILSNFPRDITFYMYVFISYPGFNLACTSSIFEAAEETFNSK